MTQGPRLCSYTNSSFDCASIKDGARGICCGLLPSVSGANGSCSETAGDANSLESDEEQHESQQVSCLSRSRYREGRLLFNVFMKALAGRVDSKHQTDQRCYLNKAAFYCRRKYKCPAVLTPISVVGLSGLYRGRSRSVLHPCFFKA